MSLSRRALFGVCAAGAAILLASVAAGFAAVVQSAAPQPATAQSAAPQSAAPQPTAPQPAAAQSTGKTIHDGVFTPQQIERGTVVFENVCAECHPKDFFSPAYMVGWNGASVGELLELVRDTMPYENPGSLEPEDYVDVLTYIFSLNGVRAGDTELPTATDALFEITIDGPYEWQGAGRR